MGQTGPLGWRQPFHVLGSHGDALFPVVSPWWSAAARWSWCEVCWLLLQHEEARCSNLIKHPGFYDCLPGSGHTWRSGRQVPGKVQVRDPPYHTQDTLGAVTEATSFHWQFFLDATKTFLTRAELPGQCLLVFSPLCLSSSSLHSLSFAQVECGIKVTDWFGCKSLSLKFWRY